MLRKLNKNYTVTIPHRLLYEIDWRPYDLLEITLNYGNICLRKLDPSHYQLMEKVGIMRKLDNVKKISIPIEFLHFLNIPVGTMFDLTVDLNRSIIFKVVEQ